MLKNALISKGTYSPNLDPIIELGATELMALKNAQNDIAKLKKTYVVSKSREDEKRYSPHPSYKVLADASNGLRRTLSALNLTLEHLNKIPPKEKNHNPVSDFIDECDD